MRIPLDYYRILGVPIQATAEQLQQAYSDRIVQLPRREYSELAIAARKQLLDEAYVVLRDPEQRQAYDASFLSNSYDRGLLNSVSVNGADLSGNSTSTDRQVESATAGFASISGNGYPAPTIDITEEELIGALLILEELGEYELVLKLGRNYLHDRKADLGNNQFGDRKIIGQDIVLTVALACLELGREQWQQRRYEDAAQSLTEGQNLLLQEGIFANVRGEIQADLYKLRPYRILELVALPEEKLDERRQGLHLLQEVLQERGGMDGDGNDRSGLSIDDFLRFIQQIRPYLTSAEQQVLFEQEARRPSAVATYLAVYALLARGFSQRQPALTRRAKLMLMRLGKRQDVHLEQAVCALLLGQTDEASRALEFSGEYESLAFIREHSQGAPDLLPGLCLYSERWLQSEVFPHFRDLAKQQVSLKDYFADEQLQNSLEALPANDDTNEWEVVGSQRLSTSSSVGEPAQITAKEETVNSLKNQFQRTKAIIESKASAAESTPGTNTIPSSGPSSDRVFAKGASSTILQSPNPTNIQTLPAAERINPKVPAGASKTTPDEQPYSAAVATSSTPGLQSLLENSPNSGEPPSELNGTPGKNEPPKQNQGIKRTQRSHPFGQLNPNNLLSRSKEIPHKWLLAGLLGIGAFIFFIVWAQKTLFSQTPQPAPQPMVQEVEPVPSPTPETDTSLLSSPGPVTPEIARQAIDTWLNTKTKAFGPDHEVDQLKEILVNPALSRWQSLAQSAKRRNWYRDFKHEIKPDSIKIRQINANQARVEAQVSESAQHFQNNKLIQKDSYDSNLRVRYDLVRQNGQWRIQNMRVL